LNTLGTFFEGLTFDAVNPIIEDRGFQGTEESVQEEDRGALAAEPNGRARR